MCCAAAACSWGRGRRARRVRVPLSGGVALVDGGIQFADLVVRQIPSADLIGQAVERRQPQAVPDQRLVYDPQSGNVCPWSAGMRSRCDSGQLWLLPADQARDYWVTGLFIPPDDLGERLARQVTAAKRARDGGPAGKQAEIS